MLNISTAQLDDFYFNGHWLSEYSGVVAGKEGLKNLSVLPARDIKTEKIMGQHGELVYSSSYQPRTFTVPVYFTDLTKIRDIAGWLSTDTPQYFYFKNDTVKIKAMFDSLIDIEMYCLQGIVELKFLCHSPFYVAVTDTLLTYSSFASQISFTNSGNKVSYPLVKVVGSGNITVTFNKSTSNEVAFTITGMPSSLYVDGMNYSVYYLTTNYLSKFSGSFPILQAGTNKLDVTGTCTSLEIQCRSEWV